MRRLTEFAMNSIIDELEERYEEAKKEFEAEPTDPYKQSMYVAFLQLHEIIEDRIDL